MTHKILLLAGDGIGPEIVGATEQVLDALSSRFGFACETEHARMGGCAIDADGTALPDATLDLARAANAAGGRLAQGLAGVDGASLLHPADANMIFASFSRAKHRAAQDAGAKYYFWPFNQSLDGPDEEALSARLVCSWCTSDEDVDAFLGHLV